MTEFTKDYEDMKILLQESDYAFSVTMQTGGSANSDFADYASNNFIRSFRHVMQKPDLSRAQLASMLRNAERRKNRRDNDESWADFMAKVITTNANSNNCDVMN